MGKTGNIDLKSKPRRTVAGASPYVGWPDQATATHTQPPPATTKLSSAGLRSEGFKPVPGLADWWFQMGNGFCTLACTETGAERKLSPFLMPDCSGGQKGFRVSPDGSKLLAYCGTELFIVGLALNAAEPRRYNPGIPHKLTAAPRFDATGENILFPTRVTTYSYNLKDRKISAAPESVTVSATARPRTMAAVAGSP